MIRSEMKINNHGVGANRDNQTSTNSIYMHCCQPHFVSRIKTQKWHDIVHNRNVCQNEVSQQEILVSSILLSYAQWKLQIGGLRPLDAFLQDNTITNNSISRKDTCKQLHLQRKCHLYIGFSLTNKFSDSWNDFHFCFSSPDWLSEIGSATSVTHKLHY